MIGASVLLGWLAAGRVLRPLRVMTTTTRQISERNLHERLALAGPDDELKDLGDTIDGLLARLEAAFDSQRRFVANASHELRTPLMLSQTLLQVALANPAITLDSLRAACQEAIDAGKDQAQLIDALLTLARSQRGLDHREPVDLTAVVNDALNAHEPSAAARGLQVDAALDRCRGVRGRPPHLQAGVEPPRQRHPLQPHRRTCRGQARSQHHRSDAHRDQHRTPRTARPGQPSARALPTRRPGPDRQPERARSRPVHRRRHRRSPRSQPRGPPRTRRRLDRHGELPRGRGRLSRS